MINKMCRGIFKMYVLLGSYTGRNYNKLRWVNKIDICIATYLHACMHLSCEWKFCMYTGVAGVANAAIEYK